MEKDKYLKIQNHENPVILSNIFFGLGDFKMRENFAAAMSFVGVHNFSCVLVFKKIDTLKSKIPGSH
jgi:hypothetical protein